MTGQNGVLLTRTETADGLRVRRHSKAQLETQGEQVRPRTTARGSTINRATTWFAAVVVAVATVGFSADSAFAGRAYDSSISPISTPWSVAFDASGNAWIPASGTNSVYVQDPYPSQNRLRTVDTSEEFEFQVVQLAIDKSTGNFYLAQSNGRALGVYDEDGNHLETWTAINGHRFAYPPGLHVAVDNSNGYSRGRLYLSLTALRTSLKRSTPNAARSSSLPPPHTSTEMRSPGRRRAPSAKSST